MKPCKCGHGKLEHHNGHGACFKNVHPQAGSCNAFAPCYCQRYIKAKPRKHA